MRYDFNARWRDCTDADEMGVLDRSGSVSSGVRNTCETVGRITFRTDRKVPLRSPIQVAPFQIFPIGGTIDTEHCSK